MGGAVAVSSGRRVGGLVAVALAVAEISGAGLAGCTSTGVAVHAGGKVGTDHGVSIKWRVGVGKTSSGTVGAIVGAAVWQAVRQQASSKAGNPLMPPL